MRRQIALSDMSPGVNRRSQPTGEVEVLKSLGYERGHCCPHGGMCAHVSMFCFVSLQVKDDFPTENNTVKTNARRVLIRKQSVTEVAELLQRPQK